MPTPRVLLIAEEANPEWTSIPLEGWSHSQAIARRVQAHLVTQVRNRDALLRAGLVEGRDFTAIDSEAVAARMHRLAGVLRGGRGRGWTTVMALSSLSYAYFERLLWKQFGARIAAREFDLVHRLTPLSPTVPSRLATRCRKVHVPFVLGPLNGGLPWPRAFDAARRREREWLSYVRGLHRLMPGYRATRRDAAAIIIGSRATWAQMPARWLDRCVYIAENGIDPQRFPPAAPRGRASLPLRAAFVGRLVSYKGADMLIEAAAPLLAAGKLELTIVGDGPEMASLRGQAGGLGVDQRVHFTGNVPHTQVQKHLSTADLFTFPSVREFGGAVVIEAMAMGAVPVIADYGGPAELIDEATGFAVPFRRRDDLVRGFRATLERLAADPSILAPMSAAAHRRAREQFSWDAKAGQVLEVYEWVLGRREKPEQATGKRQ